MPRPLIYVGVLLVILALLPIAWLARARYAPQSHPRIQVVYDMDDQPKLRTQASHEFFADGRAMRQPVEGTVAREDFVEDAALTRGRVGEDFVSEFPVRVDADLLRRGRNRFDVYCAPCHGLAGRGDGPVHRRAASLAEGTWTQPTDVTADAIAAQPVGQIYNTIVAGKGETMPSYAEQIEWADRWAVVAYVRALQRSVRGSVEDVPETERASLR